MGNYMFWGLALSYSILQMAGKGKGKGKGKNGTAVGRKSIKRTLIGGKNKQERATLTLGGIRRLARRGGVKRVSLGVYEETRDFVDYYLGIVVKDAAVYCENSRRKTITAMDVIFALKRSGRIVYGYGV